MPDYATSAINTLTGLSGLGSFNHLGDVNASNLANMQSHLTAAQVWWWYLLCAPRRSRSGGQVNFITLLTLTAMHGMYPNR